MLRLAGPPIGLDTHRDSNATCGFSISSNLLLRSTDMKLFDAPVSNYTRIGKSCKVKEPCRVPSLSGTGGVDVVTAKTPEVLPFS